MMYKSGRLLLWICVLCLVNKCDIINIVVCSQIIKIKSRSTTWQILFTKMLADEKINIEKYNQIKGE